MDKHHFDLPIRALIFKEGRDFLAHALELDLVGSGDTAREAMEELREMIFCQLSFSSQVGKPEMVYHPAPQEYFDRWDAANKLAVQGIMSPDVSVAGKVVATFVNVTEKEIKEAIKNRQFSAQARESLLAQVP